MHILVAIRKKKRVLDLGNTDDEAADLETKITWSRRQ